MRSSSLRWLAGSPRPFCFYLPTYSVPSSSSSSSSWSLLALQSIIFMALAECGWLCGKNGNVTISFTMWPRLTGHRIVYSTCLSHARQHHSLARSLAQLTDWRRIYSSSIVVMFTALLLSVRLVAAFTDRLETEAFQKLVRRHWCLFQVSRRTEWVSTENWEEFKVPLYMHCTGKLTKTKKEGRHAKLSHHRKVSK